MTALDAPLLPDDELLHPIEKGSPFALTETWYHSFHIPAQGINGEIYIWVHPIPRVVAAGFLCWRGFKQTTLAADYFDYRVYMPVPDGDMSGYTLPNGLRVAVIEPLQEIEIDYVDLIRKTELHVVTRGVMRPLRQNPFGGGHFEQAMKVEGQLILHGEEHVIDCYATRDRSWGEPREETPRDAPPSSWLAGVFNERFAFQVAAFDDPALGPEWAGAYAIPGGGSNLRAGYVHRDGVTRRLSKAAQLTQRVRDGLEPQGVQLELEDTDGNIYRISGEVTARCPWSGWPNMMVYMCQTRWQSEGLTGWGDLHDAHYNDYVRRFG
jgi:hypothetical protein